MRSTVGISAVHGGEDVNAPLFVIRACSYSRSRAGVMHMSPAR